VCRRKREGWREREYRWCQRRERDRTRGRREGGGGKEGGRAPRVVWRSWRREASVSSEGGGEGGREGGGEGRRDGAYSAGKRSRERAIKHL
jgi:hypothetical protein